MSELINKNDNRATIRWKLLTGVSALALTACITSPNGAKAADADRPLIWIELGGQADTITGQGETFVPDFLSVYPNSSVLWGGVSPIEAQRPPLFNIGEEASISFQPENSDWVFSAAIRYGKTNPSNEVDHQTNKIFYTGYKSGHVKYNESGIPENPRGINKFSDTTVHQSERHLIMDFTAGKDVGLGLFGTDSTSTLSAGVRIAQFSSRNTFDIRARPEMDFKYYAIPSYHLNFKFPYYHTYHATGQAARSFRGLGPMLTWSNTVPFAGNTQDGEVTLDWGINAALLFGKQKAHVRHQESAHYVTWQFALNGQRFTAYNHPPAGHVTDRSVTVPNVGGTVGLSYRYQDAKISLGYRADFFFGAIDAGIDAPKNETLGFKGPYASISFGLGD